MFEKEIKRAFIVIISTLTITTIAFCVLTVIYDFSIDYIIDVYPKVILLSLVASYIYTMKRVIKK